MKTYNKNNSAAMNTLKETWTAPIVKSISISNETLGSGTTGVDGGTLS